MLDTSCCPLSGAQSITNPHNSSHRRKCDCLSFLPFRLLVQPMLQAALCETDAYCPSDNLGWRATWDSICGPARRRLSQHASRQCSLDYLSPYGSWHLHAPPSSRFCATHNSLDRPSDVPCVAWPPTNAINGRLLYHLPTLMETNCNRAWFQYNHIVEQVTLGSFLTGLRISASLPPKTFIATLRKRSRSRRQKAS